MGGMILILLIEGKEEAAFFGAEGRAMVVVNAHSLCTPTNTASANQLLAIKSETETKTKTETGSQRPRRKRNQMCKTNKAAT